MAYQLNWAATGAWPIQLSQLIDKYQAQPHGTPTTEAATVNADLPAFINV